jgi:retron-type reverse transcriptase
MPDGDPLKAKEKTMKRIGNLFERIASLENLQLADERARKGKLRQYGVRMHDLRRDDNLAILREQLLAGTFRTSDYTTFKVYEPKEREVFRLPYFPDRIAHHAIMNVLETIFMAHFTADTYSCVKGRGIHGAFRAVRRALRDEAGTQYCLKLDIKKFYPSIRHNILKGQLRRKFKDERLLWLLDEIIDSAPGIPIGNYLSQYFANFYLTGLDHWLKQEKKVRYYFRYADDLVILAPDKASLHQLLDEIRIYLAERLMLEVKGNYQVFPVKARGIDFIGYVFRHTHIRIRKSIKKNFARAMAATKPSMATAASYYGWACHADSNHLLNKLLSHEKFRAIWDSAPKPRLHRRQNKDRPGVECSSYHPPLPH